MVRILLSLGLSLATLTAAEARGFRVHFGARPHASAFRPSEARLPIVVPRLTSRPAEARGDVGPVANPDPMPYAYAPPVPRKPSLVKAATRVDPAHWCDNGLLVGSGTGFCVVKVSAGAPS